LLTRNVLEGLTPEPSITVLALESRSASGEYHRLGLTSRLIVSRDGYGRMTGEVERSDAVCGDDLLELFDISDRCIFFHQMHRPQYGDRGMRRCTHMPKSTALATASRARSGTKPVPALGPLAIPALDDVGRSAMNACPRQADGRGPKPEPGAPPDKWTTGYMRFIQDLAAG